ncbi:hypothetical protein EDD15DRAFT_544020 [Pisolithus albus]|nr:hypothetical protein EDD15DRAFT_544020 [Pisolithus albus]
MNTAVVPVLDQKSISAAVRCPLFISSLLSLVLRAGYPYILLIPSHTLIRASCSRTCLGVSHSEVMTSSPQQHSDMFATCPGTLCLYNTSDDSPCCVAITCGTAPTHLMSVHGIGRLSRSATLQCGWQGCGYTVLRNNFTRHIREVHLGHGRRVLHQ